MADQPNQSSPMAAGNRELPGEYWLLTLAAVSAACFCKCSSLENGNGAMGLVHEYH
jgi:hypothetical protein